MNRNVNWNVARLERADPELRQTQKNNKGSVGRDPRGPAAAPHGGCTAVVWESELDHIQTLSKQNTRHIGRGLRHDQTATTAFRYRRHQLSRHYVITGVARAGDVRFPRRNDRFGSILLKKARVATSEIPVIQSA